MVNVNKLKAKIVENATSIEELAEKLNKNKSTLYRKINSGKGDDFTIGEIDGLIEALHINSPAEIASIFFAQVVA